MEPADFSISYPGVDFNGISPDDNNSDNNNHHHRNNHYYNTPLVALDTRPLNSPSPLRASHHASYERIDNEVALSADDTDVLLAEFYSRAVEHAGEGDSVWDDDTGGSGNGSEDSTPSSSAPSYVHAYGVDSLGALTAEDTTSDEGADLPYSIRSDSSEYSAEGEVPQDGSHAEQGGDLRGRVFSFSPPLAPAAQPRSLTSVGAGADLSTRSDARVGPRHPLQQPQPQQQQHQQTRVPSTMDQPQPAVIDLTEEPDSPVQQHRHFPPDRRHQRRNDRTGQAGPSRAGASRSAHRPASHPAHQATVIDLTGDADDAAGTGDASDIPFYDMRLPSMHPPPLSPPGFDLIEDPLAAAGPSRNARPRAPSTLFSFAGLGGLNALSFGNIGNLAQFTNFAFDNLPSISASHRRAQQSRSHHHGRSHARAHGRGSRGPRGAHGHGGVNADHGQFLDFDFEVLGGMNPLHGNIPDLNYRFNGLYESMAAGLAANIDKPPYVAPPDPLDGYTRSTGGDLVAVCAGCDEELVYDPDSQDGEPPAKRSRNRKEREEHHFWAVTACGHVYCKRCFENRKNCIKGDKAPSVFFKTDGKAVLCAVEDCQNDVTAKKAWVGLFA